MSQHLLTIVGLCLQILGAFFLAKGVIVSANGQSISAPLTGVPAVDASGQAGLLDVAVDPQFATNRRVYLAYSELVSGANGTAVARGTLNAARPAWTTSKWSSGRRRRRPGPARTTAAGSSSAATDRCS